MPKFSIVIIGHNESKVIPRIADSLKTFLSMGGDVVFLDTGSTDGTAPVARKLGFQTYLIGEKFLARVSPGQMETINRKFVMGGDIPLDMKEEMVFDFGSARQYAAGLAKNDHVFHLDSSDVLLACAVQRLDDEIGSRNTGVFDYQLEAASSNPQVTPISLTISRFYDRRRYHWEGMVHEGVYLNQGADAGEGFHCDASTLLVRHIKNETKIRPSYIAGLALTLIANPENPRWYHYLGREFLYRGNYKSAIKLLEDHAEMESAWAAERCESLCLAGGGYDVLGDQHSAADCYARAIRIDPSRREPFLRQAELSQRMGNHPDALHHATLALKIAKASSFMELASNYTFRPHVILYLSLEQMGDRTKARENLERCLSYEPENQHFQRELRRLGGIN